MGVDEIINSHGMTGDRPTAAALALEAGLDVELPTYRFFSGPLPRPSHPVACRRRLSMRLWRAFSSQVRAGPLREPYVDPEEAGLPSADDRALAREMARQSMVLLSNSGILPLRRACAP